MKPDCILLLSGGIDSTTVLADLVAHGRRPMCLIFDYGQTLAAEILVAVNNAERYRCPWQIVNLDMRPIAPDCALLQADAGAIPHGRDRQTIADSGTPVTYVPFRNGILLAWAVAYGEAHHLRDIFMGANGLDSGNYWDDTRAFAEAFTLAARQGTAPHYQPTVHFPLAELTKAQVVAKGRLLAVDYSLTWSCYMPGTDPCFTCDSCVQRLDAFRANGLNTKGN